jgi:hypothetical protein
MSLRADFNLNALKDTYDHSWFLARLDKDRCIMTYWPAAPRAAAVTFSVWWPLCSYFDGDLYGELYGRHIYK